MNEICKTNSTTVPGSAGTVTDILYQSYAASTTIDRMTRLAILIMSRCKTRTENNSNGRFGLIGIGKHKSKQVALISTTFHKVL